MYTSLQRRVLAATSICYIIVVLDTSIVNVALERIATSLATPISGLQWVVNAYTLTFASLLLTGGTLSDRWGARNTYLAGLTVFTLASALCGIAPNIVWLIVARTVQGIGAALLVPCALTLLNDAYPNPSERAQVIGLWTGCGGVAMAAGPLIGGILIHWFGWRSIFLANVPIGLIGVALTWRLQQQERTPSAARALDLRGQLAAILALGSLIAVLIEGATLGWQSRPILVGIAVCVLAWCAFLWIERSQPTPMLPLSFFKNRIFSGSAVASMVSTGTFFGLLFVFSLYFQKIRGYSPLQTGLAFLPLTAVLTAGNMLAGKWVKARDSRGPVLTGIICSIVGLLGILLPVSTAHYWVTACFLLAIGLGGGLISPAATTALIGTVEKSRAGIAAGVLNSARQTGAALCVALFGSLLVLIHPFVSALHIILWICAAMFALSALFW